MNSEITVYRKKEPIFKLNSEVFFKLFDSTVVRRERVFFKALNEGYIQFDDFLKLSRKSEVPYPLFFLNKELVVDMLEKFNKKVYFGVSKDQLSLSSRGDFSLADISLILKDITRKQKFLKKDITQINTIAGRFSNSSRTIKQEAEEVRDLVGYDIEKIFKLSKENTFKLLDKGLSRQNVYISLHIHNYFPQNISKSLQFSGIAINDKKCPFLFIKAGDYDSKIELWGRRLFTTILLLSCLLHSDCRPVTMDGCCRDLIKNDHYIFAEEFLMPEKQFSEEKCASIETVKELSTKYSVSPSAIVMRLNRLKMINDEVKNDYLDRLFENWNALLKSPNKGRKIEATKAIVRYNNRAFVDIVVSKYDSKSINATDLKNLLCVKKGELLNLEALRNG